MAQIKIFAGHAELGANRERISDAIHSALVAALGYPAEKRFQRFFALAEDNFVYPSDRSDRYIIIEISLFEGRSVETKKALIRHLFKNFAADLGLPPNGLEITLFESPRENWGIRGRPADELELNYTVGV